MTEHRTDRADPADSVRKAGQLPPDPHAEEPEPHEECGVFGVWAPGEDVSKLTYFGLFALQHRGQEAAGIAVSDGRQVVVFKDLGLCLARLAVAHAGVGPTRRSPRRRPHDWPMPTDCSCCPRSRSPAHTNTRACPDFPAR